MQRLNWGSSFDVREGWTNSDRDDHGQEHVGDILDGLPFPDNHFDYIVANHSLQMIRFHDLPQALGELRRVLKPSGTLRILVPDAGKAIDRWQVPQGDPWEPPISEEIEGTEDGRYLRYIFWHGDTRSAFTQTSLKDTLQRNGFVLGGWPGPVCGYKQTYSDYPEIVDLDSREDESLIMEAVK